MPRPLYVSVLDHVLRQSFGHPLSVQLLALSSLVLLLSFSLFSLSPWWDDESWRYVRSFQSLVPVELGSRTVDHLVVFLAILPPAMWLLLAHVAYLEWTSALLLLRVASCLTANFALTVLLVEFLSRRAMLALVALVYASLGLMYSWGIPLWKWYQEEARTKGLVGFLPQSTQELLLQTSLLEWLTDTHFSDILAPLLLFLLPLTRAEQTRLMERIPPEAQIMMTKPGLVPLLPGSVQKLLLPAQDSNNDSNGDKKGEEATANEGTLVSQMEMERVKVSRMEQKKMLPSTSSTTAGFDFHRPDVVGTVRTPPSREQILNEIVASRMWNGCKELVNMPTSKELNRTAAISSALLVMQLYASRRSRKVFLTSVHFVATMALSSVACCAIFLRFVQLLDLTWTSGRAVPLMRYARQYLLRNGSTGMPQVFDLPAHGVPITLRSTASSVSVVVAALYVLRKLRR